MYFKKLLLLTSILGLVIAGYISWQIYGVIFNPNTNFEQAHILVHVHEDDSFENIFKSVKPFLENPDSFKTMAKKRALGKYARPGVYRIKKGMNNNEIIDVLTGRVP